MVKMDNDTNNQHLIRNFAIIAHIDHGKSTLADRLIEICGGLSSHEMHEQVLDNMDIERERGITVKAQTVRLHHRAKDGKTYVLNLIDTPGHVDFSYEVSRSLSACEGALLIVDASQGIEAQTLVNAFLAIDNNLEILPVLNKIDLPAAEPEQVMEQIEAVIGLPIENTRSISAKTGFGISELLEDIVTLLPAPPSRQLDGCLKALLIDSWYDSYLGVVVLVRVFEGRIRKNDRISMMTASSNYSVEKLGMFAPRQTFVDTLQAGDIGFLTAAIRNVSDTRIGDTITGAKNPASSPLPGFKQSQPVVFCGIYPTDSSEYELLKEATAKLRLNDASFSYEVDKSSALGFGFRCGFLGLLHLEIICERLEREFNISLITTSPSVIYEIELHNGSSIILANPADMPDSNKISATREPWIEATMLVPEQYLGDVITLCSERRGEQVNLEYSASRVILSYRLPLNEVVFDFYDRLKSITRGYASFDYRFIESRIADLVKMSILINGEGIDALAMIVHSSRVQNLGRKICERLKSLIPKHLFKIPIQASIGSRIIARETIGALRKDVTAKCYGGDITRKRKLLDKQKLGKKRMRQFGKVSIPQNVFVKVLKLQD